MSITHIVSAIRPVKLLLPDDQVIPGRYLDVLMLFMDELCGFSDLAEEVEMVISHNLYVW